MNAAELSRFLASRAEDVCELLLPSGKASAGEWKAGSVNGEPGQSLSVRLSGAKAGVWKDFNAGESGDLIDLWMAAKGVSIGQAMQEIHAHFGLKRNPLPTERKAYKRPAKPAGRAAQARVVDWLMGRGITAPTIEAFKIVEQVRDGKTYAVFPYLRDGEYVNGKYRNIDEKKDMRQEAGSEPCLFGWHLIDANCRRVAIAEGEIDAMTLHQIGIPALSVNAGAGNHQWIDSDWERLERFSEILLCYDNDDAGNKGVREVANRLGLDRCRIVHFGAFKDASEAFNGGMEPREFRQCIDSASTLDPDELRSLADYWEEVKASFWPNGKRKEYPALQFCGVHQDWFEFRPGELTVWTGYNGHGKSLLLNQVMIGLLKQGERCCVYSGEMTPEEQGKRVAKQLTGIDRATIPYLDKAGEWLSGKYWIFALVGTGELSRILEVFRYGHRRYGITQFVVDSLMMLDVPEDGKGALTAQKSAMRALAAFARDNLVHVHLVAHPRKAENESRAPGKLDVSGSSKITDAADNVFSVWAKIREKDEEPDAPDELLELKKQRNGDTQSKKLWLFFNREARQYSTNPRRTPYHYIEFDGPPQFN